jgi:crotonobetainyl-CoA:carnitine CoA-transferase CaiB-like acyl-CoA transferase
LAGVRVLEVGVGIAVPELGQYMGDFGAEVLKVESARVLDFLRAHSGGTPETVNKTPSFNTVNRNKRSLALDLRRPEARDLVLALARVSDVVTENRPAGALERWGLGPEEFRRARPDLIVVRSQGYGATGPYRDFLAVGPNVQAFSGLTHLWNHAAPERPLGGQLNHPDHLASKLALMAVLAALERRARTGEGALIEISQAEVAAALMGEIYLEAMVAGRDAAPLGNRRLGAAPRGAYACRPEPGGRGTDRWVALSVAGDRQWAALRVALDDPAWATEPRFRTHLGRTRHADALDAYLAAWAAARTAGEAADRLRAAGVPAAVAVTVAELLEDPAIVRRGAVVVIDHPEVGRRCYLGQPVRAAGLGLRFEPAPRLGADGRAICGDLLGLAPGEIEALEEAGALERAVIGEGGV